MVHINYYDNKWELGMDIAALLRKAADLIKDGKETDAVNLINESVTADPGIADARFMAELSLINDQIELKRLIKEWEYFYSIKLVYEYCDRLYSGCCDAQAQKISGIDPKGVDTGNGKEQKDVIWWCWLQGLEAAPDIVKSCYNSLLKLGKEIIVITHENMSDYIQLPDYIMEKHAKGIITRTHLSDLIRIELLSKYGGTWIDSTVLCTGTDRIGNVLSTSPLFAYSFVMRDSVSRFMLFDSWFLHVGGYSRIIEDTKRMLWEYWKKEDTLKHYFLFHLFFSIACRKNEDELAKIPVFSNEPCHVLQLEQMQPFDENRFMQIKGMSDIHKLTYKYDDNADIKGTFLERVIG